MVLGQTEGGTEGRKVIWESVQNEDRSDIEVAGLPVDFQHRIGSSGKGGSNGSKWTSGGTPRF